MSLVNKRFYTIIMVAFVLLLTSCQQESSAEKAGKKNHETVEQEGKIIEERAVATLDDFAITAKIKREFSTDPLLNIVHIEVSTTGGVVKLSGFVHSQKSIDRAQEIARSIKEVKSIESSLLVKGY